MLGSQYFGWSHQGRLCLAANGQQHTYESNNGFAATHIALQQAVHLLATAHIGINFFYHPLLGIGKVEGQVVFVKLRKQLGVIEYLPSILFGAGQL